jgi:hypothetical protein
MNQDVYQKRFVASKILVEWNGQQIILSRNARISSNPGIAKFFGYFYSFIHFIIVIFVVWRIGTLNEPGMPWYELYIVKFMIIFGILFLQFCFYYILGWFLFNQHKLILTPSLLIYNHNLAGTGFQGVYCTIPLKNICSVTKKERGDGFGIVFETHEKSLYTFHLFRLIRHKDPYKDKLLYKNVTEEYFILVNLIENFLICNGALVREL